MARIQIKSTVEGGVSIAVDGHDITGSVLAEPAPVVSVAPAQEVAAGAVSTVTLTLAGDLDLEVDGQVVVA